MARPPKELRRAMNTSRQLGNKVIYQVTRRELTADGKLYLVHRGHIGGRERGIGSELLRSRFHGGVRLREPDRDHTSRVVNGDDYPCRSVRRAGSA